MVRNFKGVVRVSDVQEEFDNLLNTINAKIDEYNSSLNIEDVDYNNGGPDLAPYGYTLSVGGLKKVLDAYNGATLGANILRRSNGQYIISEGIHIENRQVYRLPSKVLNGNGNTVYFNSGTNSYSFDSSTRSDIYIDDDGYTLVITPDADIPVRNSSDVAHLPENLQINLKDNIQYSQSFTGGSDAVAYMSGLYTAYSSDEVNLSAGEQEIIVDNETYIQSDSNSAFINIFPSLNQTFVDGPILFPSQTPECMCNTIIRGLTPGVLQNLKFDMTFHTNMTEDSGVAHPQHKIRVLDNLGNIITETSWRDCLFSFASLDDVYVELSVPYNRISFKAPSNGIVEVQVLVNYGDFPYSISSLRSVNVELQTIKINTERPITAYFWPNFNHTPGRFLVYTNSVSGYDPLANITCIDTNEFIVNGGGGGESASMLISPINSNRISKLCNRPNATNESIPDYKMTIQSQGQMSAINGNQYLSNSDKGQFYSGSAGRNCRINLFDTQVAYHQWHGDRTDSYYEPKNFMFIPKGIPNPYNGLAGEVRFALQKVMDYILQRPSR